MDTLGLLATTISRHTPGDGVFPSPIPRLTLIRSSRPTVPMPVVYEPALCLVAQGAEQAVLAGRRFTYDPARYLLVSVDLPVVGHVVEANADVPYLCLALQLDRAAVGELAMQVPGPESATPRLGLALCDADAPLLDAASRLLGLLDQPEAAAVLAPLVEREILYRLLTGPFGSTMRQFAAGHGRTAQVGRAVAWIKRHFARTLSNEELAAAAGMSVSSLHEHFKAITAMSPLQYQKQLRLHEARCLMLATGVDAAGAAFRVGYESPSQFSREYRRLFGEPPARDILRLKAAPEVAVAA